MSSYSQATVAETIRSVTLPSLSVMASDAPTQTDCGNVSASNTLPGTDSGYASQASCAEVMEGWPVPARQKLSLHKTLKMKVFPRPISQPLWTRFYDLVELFDPKLETYLSPSHQRAARRFAFQLKTLGEDDSTAKPWFLIKCDPTLSKRIRQFFNRPSIRCHYQATAENPTQPNLEIFVVNGPPTRIANFHIQIGVPDVQQFERAGYSCSIKVTHSGGVAFGTFGGLVKLMVADEEYQIRGMTVGHIFPSSEKDESEEESDIDEEEDDDDEEEEVEEEDCWFDCQQTFEPSVNFRTRAGYFENSEWESADSCNIPHHYSQQMEDTASWSNLGRFVDISKTNKLDGRNFDWALITIEDPSAYSELVTENPIHKLGLSGELKDPLPASHLAGENRTVMLSGASSGLSRGIISLSWSYLQLPPWKRMLKTYTLTLDERESELLPGDCGSWVVDSETHEVYGYVVATDSFGEAYVIPIDFAFKDMKTQLSVEYIGFPTREEISHWLVGSPGPVSSAWRESPAPESTENNESILAIMQLLNASLKNALSRSVENVSKDTFRVLLFTGLIKIRDYTHRIFREVARISAAQLSTYLLQQHVIFVDALGRSVAIPLELMTSWAILDEIIQAKFRDSPGEGKVRRKEYILLDTRKKRDIDQSSPWEQSFMPGARITMTMVFRFTEYKDPICPRCGCKNNDKTSENECICQQCGIYYQYILEMPRPTTLPPMRRLLGDTIDPNDSNDLKRSQIIRQDHDESRYITDPNDSNGSKSSQIIRQDQDESRNEEDDLAFFKYVRIVMPSPQKELAGIFRKMQELEDAWPFLPPVRGDSYPRLPIDFSIIASKIRKGDYPTARPFIEDATYMFSYYKNDEGEIGACARRTEAYMWELFADAPELAGQLPTLNSPAFCPPGSELRTTRLREVLGEI